MYSRIISGSLKGVDGYKVTVEVDVARGLPVFDIVGLPDQSVKESKNRVVAAIRNSGYDFPAKKITVNLAPAHIKKEGPVFDLPIALGVLIAQEKVSQERCKNYCFIGELSLNGQLRPVRGVLALALEMKRLGVKGIVVPEENKNEAGVVKGLDVIPVSELNQIVAFLQGEQVIEPYVSDLVSQEKINEKPLLDLADIRGQQFAKRAVEVGCAGAHNMIFIGPPGTGKTMLAKRLPYLLPEMSFDEALETTKIHSAYGLIDPELSLVSARPFRSPHHTTSDVALIGGGSNPKPGEVSLAHNGVLFLDELPEFRRGTLEVLRQPLEDGYIHVSRVRHALRFPSSFMLVCAMNPCPCGYYGHADKPCNCTPQAVQRYNTKISGPFLDRIDIHIEMPSLKLDEMTAQPETGDDSLTVRKRISAARTIQQERFSKEKAIYTNSNMYSKLIKKFCALDKTGKELMRMAVSKLGLSARAYDRVLKVARTIADLQGLDNITENCLAEAIQYRSLDRRWN